MKHFSIIACLFFLMGVCLSSCESNDAVIPEPTLDQNTRASDDGLSNGKTLEDEYMLSEMRAYNDSLLSVSMNQTRSFSSFWKIVKSDLKGLRDGAEVGEIIGGSDGKIAGAIIGAVLYSYIASLGFDVLVECATRAATDDVYGLLDSSAKVLQKAASMDLDSLFAVRGLSKYSLSNIPSSYRASALDCGMKHNASMEFLADPNSSDYMLLPLTFIQSLLINNQTFRTTLFQELQNAKDGIFQVEEETVEDEVYNLYLEAFSVSGNLTAARSIANRYSTMITNNTSMASTDKSTLYDIFSLSVHSYDYWTNH